MIGLCSSCAWWIFPAPSGMFVPAVADGFGVCALANEMRVSGNDRVAEYGWRLTRMREILEP